MEQNQTKQVQPSRLWGIFKQNGLWGLALVGLDGYFLTGVSRQGGVLVALGFGLLVAANLGLGMRLGRGQPGAKRTKTRKGGRQGEMLARVRKNLPVALQASDEYEAKTTVATRTVSAGKTDFTPAAGPIASSKRVIRAAALPSLPLGVRQDS